jgi:hypothetical protein
MKSLAELNEYAKQALAKEAGDLKASLSIKSALVHTLINTVLSVAAGTVVGLLTRDVIIGTNTSMSVMGAMTLGDFIRANKRNLRYQEIKSYAKTPDTTSK